MMVEFFKGLSFFIVPLGFGSKRKEFFEKQIKKFGGRLSADENVTYVVVEESVSRENCLFALKKHGLLDLKNVSYVNVKWLSKCLECKALVESKNFEFKLKDEDKEVEVALGNKRTVEDSIEELSEKKQKINNEKLICSKPSSSNETETCQKLKIIEELEKLANAYSIRNDTWRSYSYTKAINAIKLYDKNISSYQEAVQIPGIGEKMALKIMEIIETGKLKKVDEIIDEKTKVLDSFCKIWGVGPLTAEGWFTQGFRTLEDLKTKAKLTKQQEIGLKLYDDLQERIPREEVLRIGNVVDQEVRSMSGSLSMELVGSYRRGKFSCGDVDVMIVNPGVRKASEVLMQLTESLRNKGYLTDDLVSLEDLGDSTEENHHKKYLGVFKFPGEGETHRRIDLFVVPKAERACALLHYTGSAMFNRSIKLWAAKKNMTLTEHGLFAHTVRKGSEVICKGELVPTNTEEDIFKELGLPYRHPHERDH